MVMIQSAITKCVTGIRERRVALATSQYGLVPRKGAVENATMMEHYTHVDLYRTGFL